MPQLLKTTLEVLLRDPIVILVIGEWRSGKTDTSLLLALLAKLWGIVDKIGSNIWTFKNPDVEYIITTGKLKQWLHADKQTKLFLFDEGLAHIPKRTAMSRKNVSVLKLLAELSKGHGRVILISQIDKLDKDVLHPAFVRARIIKLNKKTMTVYAPRYFQPRTFYKLPKSPIRFDPDRMAEFIDKKMYNPTELGEGSTTLQIIQQYARGESMHQIGKTLDIHPEKIKREIRKGLKSFLANREHFPEDSET